MIVGRQIPCRTAHRDIYLIIDRSGGLSDPAAHQKPPMKFTSPVARAPSEVVQL
jgi:hypothetical protein